MSHSGRRRGATMVAALLIGAALLAGCATQQAAVPTAGAGESVALRFGWPVGMMARVQADSARQRTVGAETRQIAVTTTYSLAVQSDPNGILVRPYGFRSQTRADGAGGPQQAAMDFLTRATAAMPSFVVAPSGQLMALRGVAELQREMLAAFDEMRATSPGLDPAMRQSLDDLFTDDRLAAGLAAQWTPLVSAWAGRDMMIGTPITGTEAQATPLVPGSPITMAYDYRITRRVPCVAGETALRCVEIVLTTTPTRESEPAIREAMQQLFMMGAPAGAAMPEVDDLEVANRFVLVTEPETLVPHRLLQERSTRGVVRAKGHADAPVSQVDRSEVVYSYQ